LATLPIDNSH